MIVLLDGMNVDGFISVKILKGDKNVNKHNYK